MTRTHRKRRANRLGHLGDLLDFVLKRRKRPAAAGDGDRGLDSEDSSACSRLLEDSRGVFSSLVARRAERWEWVELMECGRDDDCASVCDMVVERVDVWSQRYGLVVVMS
jgi:hypothetical protein